MVKSDKYNGMAEIDEDDPRCAEIVSWFSEMEKAFDTHSKNFGKSKTPAKVTARKEAIQAKTKTRPKPEMPQRDRIRSTVKVPCDRKPGPQIPDYSRIGKADPAAAGMVHSDYREKIRRPEIPNFGGRISRPTGPAAKPQNCPKVAPQRVTRASRASRASQQVIDQF
jgi:hypothetical protein